MVEASRHFAWVVAEEGMSRVHVAVYALYSYSSTIDFGLDGKTGYDEEPGYGCLAGGGHGPEGNY